MSGRAVLVLGLAVMCALPAPATAAVTMTEFSVVPGETQGGGHPNVTITQAFDYGGSTTDSVKDAFVRLQPGLLGNPQSASCARRSSSAPTPARRTRSWGASA